MGEQVCKDCPCKECTCDNCTCKPGNAGCDPCADFQQQGKSKDSIFTLIVTFNFKDEAGVDRFCNAFRPVAQYCDESEPTTVTYKLVRDMSDPKVLRIVERYTSKSAYLDTHKASAEFLSMRSELQKMQDANEVEIQGESYGDTDVGYVVKDSTPATTDVDQEVVLILDVVFENAESKDKAIGALKPLSEHVFKNEGNALTYTVLQSDKDPLRILIWERYARLIDLTEVHNGSEPFKACGAVISTITDKTIVLNKYSATDLGYVKR